MQIFRYVEQGSIEFLWISATNPAVSMPQLQRIRGILGRESVFLVVQDLYLTETARYAEVVLPAAGWGERTETFTNVDHTVHLSDKAVEPPGEARSDLDIFLDYSARMDFRTKSGAPLLDWAGPEDGFRVPLLPSIPTSVRQRQDGDVGVGAGRLCSRIPPIPRTSPSDPWPSSWLPAVTEGPRVRRMYPLVATDG